MDRNLNQNEAEPNSCHHRCSPNQSNNLCLHLSESKQNQISAKMKFSLSWRPSCPACLQKPLKFLSLYFSIFLILWSRERVYFTRLSFGVPVVIWMSGPANWLLGPRVWWRSRENSSKTPPVEQFRCGGKAESRWVRSEGVYLKHLIKCGIEIKYKVKKKWQWNRVDVFPRGDSCLLDNCLKIAKPFSMDIYHFPAVHASPNPAAIYHGRQTDQEEGGVARRPDRRRNRAAGKSNVCLETLARAVWRGGLMLNICCVNG